MSPRKAKRPVRRRAQTKLDRLSTRALSPLRARPRPAPFSRGVLDGLRRLSAPGTLSHAEIRAERKRLLPKLESEIGARKFDYTRLGVRDAPTAAEVLMTMAQQVRYGRFTTGALRRKGRYLILTWNGKVFERIVIHDRALHRQLLALADDDLKYLRADLKTTTSATGRTRKPLVVNARGDRAGFTGELGPPQRVQNVRLQRRGARTAEEFMDVAYMSLAQRGDEWHGSVLVAGEMKLPAAAAELSEQVSRQAARFSGGEELIVELASGQTVSIPAERLYFNTRGTVRVGIRAGVADRANWLSTEIGGYLETYLRLTKKIDMPELSNLTSLLFPR